MPPKPPARNDLTDEAVEAAALGVSTEASLMGCLSSSDMAVRVWRGEREKSEKVEKEKERSIVGRDKKERVSRFRDQKKAIVYADLSKRC